MAERFDLTPTTQPIGHAASAPLDPRVLAQRRRDRREPAQLSWDASMDPALMLRALVRDLVDPSVLLPAAKFMETANRMFGEGGVRVHPIIWAHTMKTIGRLMLSGRFDTATVFLRHALTGSGLAADPDEAYEAFARVVREFFPSAPRTWTGPTVTTERDRLIGTDPNKMLGDGEG